MNIKPLNFPLQSPPEPTPLHYLTNYQHNQIYIKRDDLLPFSLGGNKARKAYYFLQEILENQHDYVVTYGSHQSNHCRVIANLCSQYQLNCLIISPLDTTHTQPQATKLNFNQQLIDFCQATIIEVPLEEVAATITNTLQQLKQQQHTPYFIPGGGHSPLGTQAYIDAYLEIATWQIQHKFNFDYLFLASGTGTTQAGLVIASQQLNSQPKIIGMSVARKADYGRQVILDSITDYTTAHPQHITPDWSQLVHFYDDYVEAAYGKTNAHIKQTIQSIYSQTGVPLSQTYTGKAFTGMLQYIETEQLSNASILFLHTGALPLFLNDLEDLI